MLKDIKNSTSENDIKDAIINYTNSFNKIDDIETIEIDDIYIGLCILMKTRQLILNMIHG